MATIVARYCRKTNQLQSVQGYGRQRTHKIMAYVPFDLRKISQILVKLLVLKITMHSKEQEMQNIMFNLNKIPLCELCMDFNAIKMTHDIIYV